MFKLYFSKVENLRRDESENYISELNKFSRTCKMSFGYIVKYTLLKRCKTSVMEINCYLVKYLVIVRCL
jgi:hypothetical protein